MCIIYKLAIVQKMPNGLLLPTKFVRQVLSRAKIPVAVKPRYYYLLLLLNSRNVPLEILCKGIRALSIYIER